MLLWVFTCCQIMFDHAHAPQDTMIARIRQINMYVRIPRILTTFVLFILSPFPVDVVLFSNSSCSSEGVYFFLSRVEFSNFLFFIFKRAPASRAIFRGLLCCEIFLFRFLFKERFPFAFRLYYTCICYWLNIFSGAKSYSVEAPLPFLLNWIKIDRNFLCFRCK